MLRRPDSSFPYVLATDWSQKGMGVVLSQIDTEGKEHPVAYASKTCNPAEKNYGSCEGECLAAGMGRYGRQITLDNIFLEHLSRS